MIYGGRRETLRAGASKPRRRGGKGEGERRTEGSGNRLSKEERQRRRGGEPATFTKDIYPSVLQIRKGGSRLLDCWEIAGRSLNGKSIAQPCRQKGVEGTGGEYSTSSKRIRNHIQAP